MAVASGYVAVLVMALYVNSPDVLKLHDWPQALWGICLVVLYGSAGWCWSLIAAGCTMIPSFMPSRTGSVSFACCSSCCSSREHHCPEPGCLSDSLYDDRALRQRAQLAPPGRHLLALQGAARSRSIVMVLATGLVLPLKYSIERRVIFEFQPASLLHDAKLFYLYTMVSVFTVLIFWYTEYASHLIFRAEAMRYVGGAVGLAISFYYEIPVGQAVRLREARPDRGLGIPCAQSADASCCILRSPSRYPRCSIPGCRGIRSWGPGSISTSFSARTESGFSRTWRIPTRTPMAGTGCTDFSLLGVTVARSGKVLGMEGGEFLVYRTVFGTAGVFLFWLFIYRCTSALTAFASVALLLSTMTVRVFSICLRPIC